MSRSRSIHGSASPSLSARSPSPNFSAASAGEHANWDSSYDRDVDPSASRAGSPALSDGIQVGSELSVSAACLWEGCGQTFSQLQTMIKHIHSEHIGVNKSAYTCEWSTCPRRSIPQASRHALVSHIRAHTGEKPYTCPLAECDKSFTRSDAMAKHMRLQHNMPSPVPPRGGGNRKRKRPIVEDPELVDGPGQSAFKVEGLTPTAEVPPAASGQYEQDDLYTPMEERNGGGDYFNGTKRKRSASPESEPEDPNDPAIPPYLMQQLDPATGKILGRSPDMVRYIIVKAKHQFALDQHESLLEELRVVRNEERRMREEKERALDLVLRTYLGPQAEFLVEGNQQVPPTVPYAIHTEVNGVPSNTLARY